MQNNSIMAFRKRLKKRGYTDIKIKMSYPVKLIGDFPLYYVEATEPLAKARIKVYYSVSGMNASFKNPDYKGYPFSFVYYESESVDDRQLKFEVE